MTNPMTKLNYGLFVLFFISLISCNQSVKKPNQPEKTKTEDPTVENKKVVKESKPADFSGMVYFSAGKYMVGNNNGQPNEKPVHEIELEAYYIDKSPVTVGQFREFIQATGFETEAEKFGDSGVFNFAASQWELKKGVMWEYPLGREGEKAKDDHPVTHVSWNDALAYANWAGKRLPTEAEWEVAARSGNNESTRFSWGNEVKINGKWGANVWQGESVGQNDNEDGFMYTSPVGTFGSNDAGLTDMGGNVWNWCHDTYQLYPGNETPFRKDENVKIIRGGSFFYDQLGEDSYSVSGRSSNTHETSLFNCGFRCAADAN